MSSLEADLANLREVVVHLQEQVARLDSSRDFSAHRLRPSSDGYNGGKPTPGLANSSAQHQSRLSVADRLHHRDTLSILEAMRQQSRMISLASTVGNPTPLGLFAFGITTLLAGAELYGAAAKNMFSVALLIGGLAQLLAGMWCFRRNNTFGATAFSLFGTYWGARGLQLLVEQLHPSAFTSADQAGACIFYIIFSVVTLILFVQALRMNYALSVTVLFVALVYILLAIASYVDGAKYAAATCAIIAGSLALYVGFADFTNEIYEKPIVPLFPHPRHAADYQESKSYIPRLHAHKSAVDIPPV